MLEFLSIFTSVILYLGVGNLRRGSPTRRGKHIRIWQFSGKSDLHIQQKRHMFDLDTAEIHPPRGLPTPRYHVFVERMSRLFYRLIYVQAFFRTDTEVVSLRQMHQICFFSTVFTCTCHETLAFLRFSFARSTLPAPVAQRQHCVPTPSRLVSP